MRSFPRLALSTVPVDVTFSPLSNSATRSRASNQHRIDMGVVVPSTLERHGPVLMDPGDLARCLAVYPVCSMRDLTGFSSWTPVIAHASALAWGISGRPSAECKRRSTGGR